MDDFNFLLAEENRRLASNEQVLLATLKQEREEKAQLEQQLAQAREIIEETKKRYILIPKDENFRIISFEKLQALEQENAAMRALLEEIEYLLDAEYGVSREDAPEVDSDEVRQKLRAFLAQHKEA